MSLASVLWVSSLLATAPPTLEARHGFLFADLDRLDATPQLSLSAGLLFDGQRDGVPVRLRLSGAYVHEGRQEGVGSYATLALTKLTGGRTATSALSNTDLGLFYVWRLGEAGWLVARGGALLPTGDEDEAGARLNATVAPARLADAVLFQPGALGARSSASFVLRPTWTASPGGTCCMLRVDVGWDIFAPFTRDWRSTPRWGAGLGYRHARFAVTLEYTGAHLPGDSTAGSTLHHALGASLRGYSSFLGTSLEWVQPALTLSVPVGAQWGSAFLGVELTVRHEP